MKKKPSRAKLASSSKVARDGRKASGPSKRVASKSLKNKAKKSSAPTAKTSKARKTPSRTSAARTATPRLKPAAKKRGVASKKSGKGRTAQTAKPKEVRPPRPSTFKVAVKLYESGLKFMHSGNFLKATAKLNELIKEYPGEVELLDRANVLIQAADKRIQQAKRSPKPKTSEEYYQLGVAALNRRDVATAFGYLLNALKLTPKADHVLYALAATSAVRGERDEALGYLKQAVHYRAENRFLAVNDGDFESLSDDPEFIELIKSKPE